MVINDRYLLWFCMYVKVKLLIVLIKENNIVKILIEGDSNLQFLNKKKKDSNIRYMYNMVSIQTVIIQHLLRKVGFKNSAKCNMFIF